MLKDAVGTTRLSVTGRTLKEALADAYAQIPALEHHLCESGKLRPHILCFLNDDNTRDEGTLDLPLKDGDTITIFQAISGG
ncbi:MAG: MoaD/ThiS family protein [Planctomycetota bacterium]|nr:MoaD/ThiS family protein [Planctomycetota bacterium]